MDIATYSTLEIVGIYGKRWDVELDLRHLKTSLGMDILRCKTPSMIRKEIYVFLLAYNLLRSLMWSAGTIYSTPQNRLSLQGTRHHLINFIPKLLAATSQKRLQIYRTLLKVIAHKAVPEHPGRSEPRVRKRRPKIYPLMTKPRHELVNNCKLLKPQVFRLFLVPFGLCPWFFHTVILWATLFWPFFRKHLFRVNEVYLLAGDEVVVSKSGKKTYGLDRLFSSLVNKPISGLSFFALSLVGVEERHSFPILIEQVIRSGV